MYSEEDIGSSVLPVEGNGAESQFCHSAAVIITAISGVRYYHYDYATVCICVKYDRGKCRKTGSRNE